MLWPIAGSSNFCLQLLKATWAFHPNLNWWTWGWSSHPLQKTEQVCTVWLHPQWNNSTDTPSCKDIVVMEWKDCWFTSKKMALKNQKSVSWSLSSTQWKGQTNFFGLSKHDTFWRLEIMAHVIVLLQQWSWEIIWKRQARYHKVELTQAMFVGLRF